MKGRMTQWPEPIRESLSQSPEELCMDCGIREPVAGFKHRRCNSCVLTRHRDGQGFCTDCHTAVVPRAAFTCEPCLAEIRKRAPKVSVCGCGRRFIGARDRCLRCWNDIAWEVL